MPTTETYDFLLRTMEENWRHAREAENKRATIANVLIVTASLVQGILLFVGLQRKALPLTLWLVALGIYGVIAGAKLYERSQFHILRARKLRTRLDELYPDARVEQVYMETEEIHRKRYVHLIHVRLNTIWIGVHVLIAVLGVVYAVLCVI